MKSQFKIYAAMAAIAAGAAFAETEAPAPTEQPPLTETQPAAAAPEPAPAPAPPAPAPEPAPAPAPEPVVKAVEAVAPAAPKVPKEPLKFQFGIRPAIGVSAFRGHKALDFGAWKLQTKPALSFGFGIVSDIQFNSTVSLAPELQYTLYRANNEFAVKTGADFNDLNEAGITLHALELPILVRFNIQNAAYAEVGPQVGYNIRSVIYKNASLYQPDLNAFAFGPSVGGGIKFGDSALLGARFHFGLLEYAKDSKGYPWTFQISATQFLF